MHGAPSWREPAGHLLPVAVSYLHRWGWSLCLELPEYHTVSSMVRTRSSLGSFMRRRFSLSELRRCIARRRGGGKIEPSIGGIADASLRKGSGAGKRGGRHPPRKGGITGGLRWDARSAYAERGAAWSSPRPLARDGRSRSQCCESALGAFMLAVPMRRLRRVGFPTVAASTVSARCVCQRCDSSARPGSERRARGDCPHASPGPAMR